MSKNYFLAVATLMGAIIGVGVFAIPLAANKAGLAPLLVFMISLAGVQYFLHLLFAELVLSAKDKHRLPGFAEKYSGRSGKISAFAVEIIGSYGAMLAYIIVGGLFSHQLLAPFWGGDIFLYSSGVFIFVSLITFFDIKMIAGAEFILTSLLVAAIGLIGWQGFSHVNFSNYHLIDWQYAFLPYGPVFFAVGGSAAIPEICRLLANEKRKIKSAIAWGTFLSAGLMLFFVLAVLGITGAETSSDTLAGLARALPGGTVAVSLVFGLLAIVTSYILTAQATEEIFHWDFKLPNKLAWLLAGFIPYILYLLGWANLTKVISFTGAVTGGLSGVILIWLALKTKERPEKISVIKNRLTGPVAYLLSGLFILGMIYEIWNIAG